MILRIFYVLDEVVLASLSVLSLDCDSEKKNDNSQ